VKVEEGTFVPLLKGRLFYEVNGKSSEFFTVDDFVVEDVISLKDSGSSYLLVLFRDQSRSRNLLPRLFMLEGGAEPLPLSFPEGSGADFLPLPEGEASWQQNDEGLFLYLKRAVNYHVSIPPYLFEQREFLITGKSVIETVRDFSEAVLWSQQINLAAYYMQQEEYEKAAKLYEKGLVGLQQEKTESAGILIKEVQANLELCRQKKE
jgi:tetratricopeptide (TPR) repeat protein